MIKELEKVVLVDIVGVSVSDLLWVTCMIDRQITTGNTVEYETFKGFGSWVNIQLTFKVIR